MTALPTDLDTAIAQAREATKAAINDGCPLMQVELVIPELKAQPIAEKFLPAFSDLGLQTRVYFPDTGAAALARRDWGETDWQISELTSRRYPAETQIEADDEAILVVEPSAVEVKEVERVYRAAGDRPVVLLLPNLEDIAIIGIGAAGRQLRERFLNVIESIYFLAPLQEGTLFRCYPSGWQVWRDGETEDELIAELPRRPSGEELDRLFNPPTEDDPNPTPRTGGFMSDLQKLWRALTH